MATHYYYNGVKLPKIPADVLTKYPYCWIRNNTRTGYYDLLFSKDPWYWKDENTLIRETSETPWYQVAKASADTASEWVFNQIYSSPNWGNESDRRILWSNHDIPKGSATATSIYFKGSEPIPIEPEPSPTTITYNGTELASLESGQTANFDCNGKKAVGNVSILFGSKGTITYKGKTTEIAKGKTANLLCAGKKFATEVVIVTSALPSLDAPTISLNGNILTITGMVKNAKSYGIYVDGVKQKSVADPVNG